MKCTPNKSPFWIFCHNNVSRWTMVINLPKFQMTIIELNLQVFIMSSQIISRPVIFTTDSCDDIIFPLTLILGHVKAAVWPEAHGCANEALPLIEFVTTVKARGAWKTFPVAHLRRDSSWNTGELGRKKVILQLPCLIRCQIQYYLLRVPLGGAAGKVLFIG